LSDVFWRKASLGFPNLADNKPWRLLAVRQRQRFDLSAINMALVAFSSLSEPEQRSFISSLNIFLLSSSPQRRHFIEQWKGEAEKGTKPGA
jgi:hypothetical protein